jgi:hypothetical protein
MGMEIAELSAHALRSIAAGRDSAPARVQAIADEAARLDAELKKKHEAALELEGKIAESERKHADATQALLAEATRLRREMRQTVRRYERNQADIRGLQGGPSGSGSVGYDLRSTAPASAITTADGTQLNVIQQEHLREQGQRRLEETEDVLEIAEDDLRRSGRPYLCMDDLREGEVRKNAKTFTGFPDAESFIAFFNLVNHDGAFTRVNTWQGKRSVER